MEIQSPTIILGLNCSDLASSTSPASGAQSGEETEESGRHRHRELQRRVEKGNQEAMQCMVESGLPWDSDLLKGKETPVHAALRQKDSDLLEKLLQIQNLVHLPNTYGEAPIHLACRLGLEGAVRRLLEAGADQDAQDSEECTPLFHAVHGKCLDCAKLLVQAGCDLDARNLELLAPLDSALLHGDHGMVALLLRSGCHTKKVRGHVYWRDHYSNSLIHALCSESTLENVQLYLSCGYEVTDSEMNSLRAALQQQLSLPSHSQSQSESHARDKLLRLEAVMEFKRKPKSLMWYCRHSVRQRLMETRCFCQTPVETMIASRPVPGQLKEFLSLTEPQAWPQEGSDAAEHGDTNFK